MMKQLFILALLFVFANCRDQKKSEMISTEDKPQRELTNAQQNHPGKKLLETECYLCHNPKASQASMIAPPMIAVKRHYIDSNITKEEFTENLIRWINDPEAQTKMPGAQRKFGKMPYLPYPERTIEQIAEYVYDYEIDKPKWFDAHFEEEHGKGKGMGHAKGKGKGKGKGKEKEKEKEKSVAEKNTYIDNADIGMEYALATKAQLGKNLMKAINQKGAPGAVEFCNTRAIKLTDSISVMKNAIIKRVSDKPRNPKNVASEEELEYINYFKKAAAADGELVPIVRQVGEEVHFYAPIMTNTMCLQCHGKPNDQIQLETLTKLKNLYPADKALDYDINEVRGMWSITFDAEN